MLIELETHPPGARCSSVLTVGPFDVRLRARLGVRWVDGACVGSCPDVPDRAALHCAFAGPPFGFGYLPSGWLTAKSSSTGTAAAYQSPTGDATIELWHDRSDLTASQPGTDEVYALGQTVPIDTVAGGYAAALNLGGTKPSCGRWLLQSQGVAQTVFATIVQQLFPR